MTDNQDESTKDPSKPPNWLLTLGFAGIVFLLVGDSLHGLSPNVRDLLIALLISPMATWEIYHMQVSGRTALQYNQEFRRDTFPGLFKLIMGVFALLAVSPIIIALQWWLS